MRVLIILALLGVAAPALANHPAERIDEVMAEREPAFEAVKGPLPKLALMTDDGRAIELHEQSDKILVLSFVPAGCGAPCADQQRLLNEVQSKIGVTPMGGMVSFVTVAAPGTSTLNGWDTQNWQLAMPGGEETTAELSTELADASQRADGSMAYVIDRGAHPRAIFHGGEFGPVNMVLYINGLSNAPQAMTTSV